MARKIVSKQKSFEDTLKGIVEAETATYEKAGITRLFVVTFPNRHEPPFLGRLGVWLLQKAGGIIQTQYMKRDKQ